MLGQRVADQFGDQLRARRQAALLRPSSSSWRNSSAGRLMLSRARLVRLRCVMPTVLSVITIVVNRNTSARFEPPPPLPTLRSATGHRPPSRHSGAARADRGGACRSVSTRVPSVKASLMSWVTMMMVSPCSRHSRVISACMSAPDAGIERAEGLVEQQDARPLDQRLGDGEALLHAARHLRRIDVAGCRPARPRSSIARGLAMRLRGAAPNSRPVSGACAHSSPNSTLPQGGQMREHRVALEHHAAIGPAFGASAACRRAGSCRASAPPGPRIRRRKVLLPAPDGPMIETKEPSAISRSTVSSTTLSPYSTQTFLRLEQRAHAPAPCAQGKAARLISASSAVHDDGQQRDPGDVGQDDVHRRDSGGRGRCGSRGRRRRRSPRPRSGTPRPGRATGAAPAISRGMACGRATRSVDLPGAGAQRLRLDELLARQRGDVAGEVADHERGDADDDQRDLGRLAQAEAR